MRYWLPFCQAESWSNGIYSHSPQINAAERTALTAAQRRLTGCVCIYRHGDQAGGFHETRSPDLLHSTTLGSHVFPITSGTDYREVSGTLLSRCSDVAQSGHPSAQVPNTALAHLSHLYHKPFAPTMVVRYSDSVKCCHLMTWGTPNTGHVSPHPRPKMFTTFKVTYFTYKTPKI